jgi:hypothetical protein
VTVCPSVREESIGGRAWSVDPTVGVPPERLLARATVGGCRRIEVQSGLEWLGGVGARGAGWIPG